jgi:hypothetical protein
MQQLRKMRWVVKDSLLLAIWQYQLVAWKSPVACSIYVSLALDRQPLLHPQTHAGKICTRNWYERNKHIFPARYASQAPIKSNLHCFHCLEPEWRWFNIFVLICSRWEEYDADKDYGKYAIKDSKKKT